MQDIPFVDAHVHLWDLALLSYPWLTPPFADDGPNGSVEAIARTYLPTDYRRDAANWRSAGYVHVDAGADPAHAVEETRWLERLDDGPAGIVAFAPLDDPGIDRLLAAQASHAGVRGIRHIVNWHANPGRTYTPRDVTQDPAWQFGFSLLAKHDLSFDLQAYPGQFPGLARLIARCPDTTVIINHLGMPVPTDPDGHVVWLDGLRALAALPNVAIKISGIGFIHRPWREAQARDWILPAIDLFGPDRCLVASDFPTDKLFGGFDHTLGCYARIIADFSESERRAMWGANANRLYRLGLQLEEQSHG